MTPPSPFAAGFGGLCPRCSARTLYDGLLKFAPRCRACGLDFASFNVGDGPAAFLILVVGALVTGLALWLELAAEPPFWVHILIWPGVTLVLVVGSLRIAKGVLLTLEYRNAAREGRIAPPDNP
jgi:uncharacterized protein (DUF983 family)